MSVLDWLLFASFFVLLAIATTANEVRIYRTGGGAWVWSGKISRLLQKVGL